MERSDILNAYRERLRNLVCLNDEEWAVFMPYLKIKKIKKNACFAEEGKTCKEIGLIIKGAVRYCNIVDGKEITGYFSFENDFITAIKSYLTETPCLYYIKTLEDTLIVTVSRKNMQAMLNIPLLSCKIERFGRMLSESFNVLFEDRLKSFVLKTAEERYMDLLESGKDIINRIPVQYIAQFIGITPVSLSRIRRKIQSSSTCPTSFM